MLSIEEKIEIIVRRIKKNEARFKATVLDLENKIDDLEDTIRMLQSDMED